MHEIERITKIITNEMSNTLILTYGLSKKQFNILRKEFDEVVNLSAFFDLVGVHAAAVVVNWNRLSDNQVREFIEYYLKDYRQFNTSISLLNYYDRGDMPLLCTYETQYDTLNDTINEIKKRLSIPARFNEATNRMENTIGDIKKATDKLAKDYCYERQILMVNYIATIMNYRHIFELNCVLNATMAALGLLKIEDID